MGHRRFHTEPVLTDPGASYDYPYNTPDSALVSAWWWVNPGLEGAAAVLAGLLFAGIVVVALYRLFRVVAPEDGRLLASAGVPGGGMLARLVTRGETR